MKGDFSLERCGEWDSMGMRGTCSPPYIVSVEANSWQIFKSSFAEIAARTMVPDTHYIWSNVWLGIASDATARARVVVQDGARKTPSTLPSSARDLAELEIRLERFRTGGRYLPASDVDLWFLRLSEQYCLIGHETAARCSVCSTNDR